MTNLLIEKALAGKEDLLLGEGTKIQNRAGVPYTITKLNSLAGCLKA